MNGILGRGLWWVISVRLCGSVPREAGKAQWRSGAKRVLWDTRARVRFPPLARHSLGGGGVAVPLLPHGYGFCSGGGGWSLPLDRHSKEASGGDLMRAFSR